MEYLVYKHTSPSGKSYIGFTSDYDNRCATHQSEHSGCWAFRNAIKKYGWDSFTHEIIISGITLKQAQDFEKSAIREHNSIFPNGYNLTDGGQGGVMCDVVRQKISATKQGMLHTEASKHKMAVSKGRKYIAEAPDGEQFYVVNLSAFCDEHNLVKSNMYSVAAGKLPHYKQWRCWLTP